VRNGTTVSIPKTFTWGLRFGKFFVPSFPDRETDEAISVWSHGFQKLLQAKSAASI
jgi:hypothetical protein